MSELGIQYEYRTYLYDNFWFAEIIFYSKWNTIVRIKYFSITPFLSLLIPISPLSLCLYSIFIRQTFEMELCLHTNKWTDVDGTEEHKKDERMLNSMSTFLWIVNILFITWFHLFMLLMWFGFQSSQISLH